MSGFNAVNSRNTENAPKNIGPYSQTVAFSHYNNLSAQLPIDPATGKLVSGGIKEQAAQCFENIKTVLESIGHVMSDVVRISVFVKDIKDLDKVEAVYKTFFPTYLPTRTMAAVADLPLGAMVQIEALVSNGEGSIPDAPQAGDLIKSTNNTANAPMDPQSTQTVAFSHYNNLTAQLPIDPKTGRVLADGMVAGIGVLAAPAVIIGAGAVGITSAVKRKKLTEKKEELLKAAVSKYDAIVHTLSSEVNITKERAEYLNALNVLLQAAIRDLKADLEEVA